MTNSKIILEDQIDLQELFNILAKGKWIIVSVTTIASIIGIIFSLLLPNIYESKALLVPANKTTGISGALKSYGSLAGLAGISLPANSDESNSVQAIQKISSLSFFEKNIMANIYLPDLMALKSWNPKTNELTYDESIYDSTSNTWTRNYSYPQQLVPSAQESYDIFKNKHLSLNEDKSSGFITLSIKHQSPFIAKQWVDLLVYEVNRFYREKNKSESEKAASYLNKQISMNDLSEIKQVLAQLLQEETKKLALIEANEFYVFDYIDPPAIMEKKAKPKRAIICIFSALLGGILGMFYVIIRYYLLSKKDF